MQPVGSCLEGRLEDGTDSLSPDRLPTHTMWNPREFQVVNTGKFWTVCVMIATYGSYRIGVLWWGGTRVQLKCDGTRWRMGGEVKGKRANAVGSQYPSHYLGTRCIQHYYRWCAQLGCQQSTELTPTGRFNWSRPFRWKTKCGFCVCAITFQTQCT